MALSCLHPSSGERVQGQGQAVWFIKPALFKHVFVFKGLQKNPGCGRSRVGNAPLNRSDILRSAEKYGMCYCLTGSVSTKSTYLDNPYKASVMILGELYI